MYRNRSKVGGGGVSKNWLIPRPAAHVIFDERILNVERGKVDFHICRATVHARQQDNVGLHALGLFQKQTWSEIEDVRQAQLVYMVVVDSFG